MNYVSVTEEEGGEAVEIPVEEDGTGVNFTMFFSKKPCFNGLLGVFWGHMGLPLWHIMLKGTDQKCVLNDQRYNDYNMKFSAIWLYWILVTPVSAKSKCWTPLHFRRAHALVPLFIFSDCLPTFT